MTIVFQGHVKSMQQAAPGKVMVTLATPMDPAGGTDLTVCVPQAEAAHWLPGLAVNFTIYTLPPATGA